MSVEHDEDYEKSQLREDIKLLQKELHSVKGELVRLERLVYTNKRDMEPVVEVYKKIVASSEVGGFVAKVIGGVLGAIGAIASLWLIFRGGGGP